MLDHEKRIFDCEQAMMQLREQNEISRIWTHEEMLELERGVEKLKTQLYSQLTPWDRVGICRHPDRPRSVDYIASICEDFSEISGDRLYRNDPAVITGMGRIRGEKFVVVAQEKGCDTSSRLYRNFGMPHPEGYRKALRAMELAAKFDLPILSLIDTPGAYPGLTAEERGQGWAIANNLMKMAMLPTPIIVILIGEGCSGGALGMGVGDVVAMLEHAYYSVISPEGCAAILYRDAARSGEVAEKLKMQAEDLLRFGVVDAILEEPRGGAHRDREAMFERVTRFVLEQRAILQSSSSEELLDKRYAKFRKIGAFSVDATDSGRE